MKKLVNIDPRKRFLQIFVCIFLSFVLVLSLVLGTILIVRNARTVVKYGNTRITHGEAIYLASVFKSEYIASLNRQGVKGVKDTASFWQSESTTAGKSWGDMLKDSFKEYISGIAVKNSLYLANSKFGKDEKNFVRDRVDERLMYLGYNSEREFNTLKDKLGFDYDDMIGASELLCTSAVAFEMIYGKDGEGIASYNDECERYLETYAHVSLLFLRKDNLYDLDENGKVQYNDDGSVMTRPMTEEEKAERTETAEKLTEAMYNLENGLDGSMTAEMFEIYLKEHSDTDPNMISRGYYFNKYAEVTAQFAEVYPEVVETAYGMNIGEFAKVACSDSICFIYRYDVDEGAYADRTNVFFSDFYYNAALYCFDENLRLLSEEVVFSDKFNKIDIVEISSNSSYVVKRWN